MRPFPRSFARLVLAVAAATSCVIVAAVRQVHHGAVSLVEHCRAHLAAGPILDLAPAAVECMPSSPPRVVLVRARAFARRQVKREQPIVTPLWRMVPSI